MTGSRIIRRVSGDDTLTQNPIAFAVDTARLCAAVFVQRGDGAVLLICRSGSWSMPGGRHELGESLRDTVVRNTREETGIAVHLSSLVGIFITAGRVIDETSNDKAGQECTIVYRAEPVAGEPTPSGNDRSEWVPVGGIADLPMDPGQRERLDWAVIQPEPHIDVSML
ncbi:NUDIX hydrolase [Nocardia sp. NPDC050630]|uniref:NUDIX hydrolase n=1 Tax=Nocardia sp. NPDC050630 TaxID=3364321 RepID=UPI0037B86F4A